MLLQLELWRNKTMKECGITKKRLIESVKLKKATQVVFFLYKINKIALL